MPRNWLLAHWRRLAMQAALCALFLATIGLAALVTHEKRLALRLPLGPPNICGQLTVSMPRAWTTPEIADQDPTGEHLSSEEIVPEQLTGRRLTVKRLRTFGLVPPLQLLLRNGYVTDRDLRGAHQTSYDEQPTDPARVQPLTVAGWPGVMVSFAFGRLGSRHVQKQVLACSVLPGEQAVLIRLEGVGPPDAADEELVRQLAETSVLRETRGRESRPLLPEQSGTIVKLDDEVWTAIPPHFVLLPNSDPNLLSRNLLANRSDAAWTAAELIPCIWLVDEPPDAQFLTMLTAHDPTWKSANITRIGENLWRADQLGDPDFPIAAYCMTNGLDQALIAIVRGGWMDATHLDETWKAISSDVRFVAHRNIMAMLEAGANQAQHFRELGLAKMLSDPLTQQTFALSDPSTNSDQRDWMQLNISKASGGSAEWHGTRFTLPTYRQVGWMQPGESIQQLWTSSDDLSAYRMSISRIISDAVTVRQTTPVGRWKLEKGMLTNEVAGDGPHEIPKQYVPGAWLPLILGSFTGGPVVLRCESFLGCDGAAPAGLLTLVVSEEQIDTEAGVRSIDVTVNGSGRMTRWSYDRTDNDLRYIEFTAGCSATRSRTVVP